MEQETGNFFFLFIFSRCSTLTQWMQLLCTRFSGHLCKTGCVDVGQAPWGIEMCGARVSIAKILNMKI